MPKITRRQFLLVAAGAAAVGGAAYFGLKFLSSLPPSRLTPGLQKLSNRALNGGVVDPQNGETSLGFDRSNTNSNLRMLRGAFIGGCGFQAVAYDLIDENFLAGHGLQAFYPAESNTILTNVKYWLNILNYQSNDRRETLLAKSVPDIFLTGTQYPAPYSATSLHCPPSSDPAQSFVVTEFPDPTMVAGTNSMNVLVPRALNAHLNGDSSTAMSLYNKTLQWWNGVGFVDQSATSNFFLRQLAYWLILVRALKINSSIESDVEQRLWSLQSSSIDYGLFTQYQFSGTPFGHSSNEGNGLALLAYDPRITQSYP